MPDKFIYLVTDETLCQHHALLEVVALAAEAGVKLVQYRDKYADSARFRETAAQLKTLLARYEVPLIINDRVEVAQALGVGVHVGQGDMPYELVREKLGKEALIGLSVETWEQLRAASLTDVDYIALSPIYPTPTKTDTGQPWGEEGLFWARQQTNKPLVVIGGIKVSNLAQLASLGANGFAVVSAICATSDPFEAARTLVDGLPKTN